MTEPAPEDAPDTPPRAAAGCVLTGLGLGAVVTLLTVAPTAGILIVVLGSWAAILWVGSRRPKINNHSPPPPPDPAPETNPQVGEFIQDPDNPHRWVAQTRKPRTS